MYLLVNINITKSNIKYYFAPVKEHKNTPSSIGRMGCVYTVCWRTYASSPLSAGRLSSSSWLNIWAMSSWSWALFSMASATAA